MRKSLLRYGEGLVYVAKNSSDFIFYAPGTIWGTSIDSSFSFYSFSKTGNKLTITDLERKQKYIGSITGGRFSCVGNYGRVSGSLNKNDEGLYILEGMRSINEYSQNLNRILQYLNYSSSYSEYNSGNELGLTFSKASIRLSGNYPGLHVSEWDIMPWDDTSGAYDNEQIEQMLDLTITVSGTKITFNAKLDGKSWISETGVVVDGFFRIKEDYTTGSDVNITGKIVQLESGEFEVQIHSLNINSDYSSINY